MYTFDFHKYATEPADSSLAGGTSARADACVNRAAKGVTSLGLPVLLALVLSACDWVDSAGLSSQISQSDSAILVPEETTYTLDFESELTSGSSFRSFYKTAEGQLSECAALVPLQQSARTLSQACAPGEANCDIAIVQGQAANGAPDTYRFSVFAPMLSVPVGVSYRWEFISATGESNPIDVTLCVSAVNEPPLANPETYVVMENSTLAVAGSTFDAQCEIQSGEFSVLANDTDDFYLRQSCLQAELVRPPAFAVNDFTADFTATGGFTYTPDPTRDDREDSFVYRVTDGELTSTTTVMLYRTSDATAPVLLNDLFNIVRNSNAILVNPLGNDTDPSNSALTLIDVASLSNNGGDVEIEDNLIRYTPRRGFRGNETVLYTVRNSYGQEAQASVVFVVR